MRRILQWHTPSMLTALLAVAVAGTPALAQRDDGSDRSERERATSRAQRERERDQREIDERDDERADERLTEQQRREQQRREAQRREQPQRTQPGVERRPGSTARATGGNRLVLPGSAEVLSLDVQAPQQVRVGESYDYQIRVSNLSDDLVLHNVVIEQEQAKGFEIESSELLPASGQGQRPGQRQQDRNRPQRDQQDREQSNEQGDREHDEHQAKQESGKGGQQGQGQANNRWTIPALRPGQSRTIQVTASSDEEGANRTCLAVKSFTPALCMQTEFVRPELEVVKVAPEQAHICEVIEVEYFVKNEGSGSTGRLRIRDELAEGLRTVSGDRELQFAINDLRAGETRKFVARLTAEQSGSFSSRAVVTDRRGEETRSRAVETEIVQPELAVSIDGPRTEYADRPITYTVRVTNQGQIAAEEANLALYLPEGIRLADSSEPRDSEQQATASSNVSQLNQFPTAATQEDRQPRAKEESNVRQASGEQEVAENQAEQWKLGNLEPGQTKMVRVTLRSNEAGEFEPRAVASFVCAAGQDEDVVESVAYTRTEIISLPALLVTVVDQEDPVDVENEVVYRIIILNQGTAADDDVRIKAELPEQLEFVSATGETEVQAEGQTLTFDPVERLNAGERVEWRVRAKAQQEGEVIFKVDLTSSSQSEEVRSEEPTRLFKAKE